MEISNKLLSTQCCSYLLALLFSLFVVVPLAENGREFKGRCLLFSRAFWREENSTGSLINRFVVEEWGPSAACQFCTFVGFFTLIFCAVQAWRTLFYLCKGHDEKDMVAVEAVQRKFTRQIPGVNGLSYEEWLNSMGLYSLDFRRMRRVGDMTEIFKMVKGIDKVDFEEMFPL
eukprot:g33636.t1